MGTPYLGEVKIISWNFAPKGWAFCNGQTMLIAQNQALYAVLGTTYGGNGQQTFALPNLQGRAPNYVGQGLALGNNAGEASHTLTINEMPSHNHPAQASSTAADQSNPTSNILAQSAPSGYNLYSTNSSSLTPLSSTTVGNNNGDQPHSNLQPYLVMNFIIALSGVFPTRN